MSIIEQEGHCVGVSCEYCHFTHYCTNQDYNTTNHEERQKKRLSIAKNISIKMLREEKLERICKK